MSAQDDFKVLLHNYPSGVRSIETLEISHVNLSQTYYLTTDRVAFQAYLEDTITQVTYQPANIDIALNSTKLDLDQTFSFSIADPLNVLDDELDNLDYADEVDVIYRVYVSTDLSEPAVFFRLKLVEVSQANKTFTVVCTVSQFNNRQTGEKYSYDRFPMLRALL